MDDQNPAGDRVETVVLPPQISRLLVLGDPHGALEATQAVFQLERNAQTLACCVGDVVGYADGPSSSALAEYLADEKVPTVEGNHEDWVRPDGTLAIVDGRVSPRHLTRKTVDWLRSLPQVVEFRRAVDNSRVALLVHSIRRPRWDWLGTSNAPYFTDRLGGPRIILSGHSHRPKFLVMGKGHRPYLEAFDFESNSEIIYDLSQEGSVIVDAGSLGRAELEPGITEQTGVSTSRRYGTYAVIDLEKQQAILRRHEHSSRRPTG